METVWLQRPSADVPWGFRLHGGRDYQTPLTVQKVTPGSIAATGLAQDDVILRIGDTDTSSLTYAQAMDVIKNSGNLLQLSIAKRGGQGDFRHQPTRLEQQLSNMSVGSDYGRQNSYQSPMSPSPSHPPGAPPTPPGAPPGPYYGAPKTPQSPGAAPPTAHRPQPTIPDAVLNMAAKGEPDKKPWTYAPDMDSIREQRDKVRRRTPHGGMPRYQQVLNLPKFDDPPRPRAGAQQTPPHTPGGPQTSATPDYAPGPGRATVAHLQYNSPLYLYSEDKVAEAFSGQTEGIVTGVAGLKKDQGKDITQSPVYRMVHGLDDDKPKTRRHVADEASPYKAPRAPAEDDELKFSGVIDKSEIPSKSFHRLQNMTAGSEIDTTSIRQNISGEVPDDEIGAYDQASIRYTGKNIPSRSFKMLQSLTGDDSSATDLPVSQPRRQRRQRPPPEAEEPEQNPDDIVDISYVGSNIPSRSFKVLQHAVGEQDTTQPDQRVADQEDDENADGIALDEMYYLGANIPSRSFQLLQSAVGSDPHAIAQERRLRRRKRISSRQNSRTEEEVTSEKSDQSFDEQAYLAGQIALNVDPVERTKPKRAGRSVSRELAPWEKKDKDNEANTIQNSEFDEEAYLSGKIPILGNERKRVSKSLPPEMTPANKDDDKAEDDNRDNFDEEAYLAGRISILGGEPKPRQQPASKGTEVEIPWKKSSDDEKLADNSEFDEEAYLAKSGIPRSLIEQKTDEVPEWLKKQRAKLARKQKSKGNQFDEEKFLGVQKQERSRDDTEEDANQLNENFDEEAYLAGQIQILGGSPPVPKREPKPVADERVPWQKDDDVEGSTDDSFDEEAYLQGKVPILRDSVPRELPPRDINKPKNYRQRAPWERVDDDDKPVDADKEFDEAKYLAGRADAYVRKSVDRDLTSPARNDDPFSKIPSRTFHYLRRSVSREGSPSSSMSSGRPPSRQSSYDSAEDDEGLDPNKPYNEMVYVGDKIPSKTFLRLKKSVSRKSERRAADPIEHLKERMTDSVDVDSAIENLNIDQHDPDEYLDQLKQAVEAKSNIKIEAVANEVTDF